MKLRKIIIHNFKGIKEIELNVINNILYLVSNNNVGKTRILKSIDNFYNGKESAETEMTFEFSDSDLCHLSNNYELKFNEVETFKQKDKKIFVNDIDITSNIRDNFILGKCFYIPTIVDIQNEQDLSKTKNQLSTVIINLISDNSDLQKSLDKLNDYYNDYVSRIKNYSKYLFNDINKSILFDDMHVDIDGKQIKDNQLIKNNLSLIYKIGENEVNLEDLGTGVQANIINSILTNFPKNQYTIILYDEPESFLNSTAQKKLITNIEFNIDNSLYIIATHSPFLIKRSKNTFKSIIRLKNIEERVVLYQYSEEIYRNLIRKANCELRKDISDSKYFLNEDIYKTILTWWETDRINALFEDKIFLVEGPSEIVFFDMCCGNEGYLAINAIGKFKMPYFKILLSDILGIDIICIFDKDDETKEYQRGFNNWIKNNFNKYIEFDKDFENELGYIIKKEDERRKPEIFMEKYLNNEIDEQILSMKARIDEIYTE